MRAASSDRDRLPADVFTEPMRGMQPTYHRLSRLRVGLRPMLLALLAGALLAVTSSASAKQPQTLIVEGTGEGHGVGMSQDGALGYARHGLDYAQILSHYYAGTALAPAPAETIVRVLIAGHVKRVQLERYVRGVVGNEVSSGWPAAVLQAQAVASRTFALTAHAGGERFDVYADSRSQVYRGAAAETPATNAAVAATAGQIVTYAGRPAITYFFASSGGMTESVQYGFPGSTPQPWLVAVPDSYEGGSSRWKLELPFATAAKRLRGLYGGAFKGVEVLRRGVSPRVLSARVLGTAAATVLSGAALAARLGLNSTWGYFAVRSGSRVRALPDKSGRGRAWGSAPADPGSSGGVSPTPAAPGSPSTGAGGGTAAGA
jgi:SpoIID/LytB domain protein